MQRALMGLNLYGGEAVRYGISGCGVFKALHCQPLIVLPHNINGQSTVLLLCFSLFLVNWLPKVSLPTLMTSSGNRLVVLTQHCIASL